MATRLKRDRARANLAYLLKIAEDAPFFQMIWCADRIRVREFELGARGMSDIPQNIFEDVREDRLYFQPWILEDLINEYLSTPKSRLALPRRLRCESYNGFADAYNAMLAVDDTESGFEIDRGQDVLQMMPRFAHRQFEWQRGWLNGPSLYRSAFIYGKGECADWFNDNFGVTPAQLMLFAMAAHSVFNGSPEARSTDFAVAQLGLGETIISACIRLVSSSLDSVKAEATRLRRAPANVAAKPSVLRRTPIVAFGGANGGLRAPLPDLLLERATTGLYLDLVRAPDTVRNAIAERFERYSFDLFEETFGANVRRQYQYGPRGRPIDTPDLFVGPPDAIDLLVECKATRMTFEVRFSDAWHEATERGYRELAKGVGQIWRHVSHMRRGLVTDRPSPQMSGLVLTLDPWMRMTHGQDEIIFRMAREWCAQKDVDITAEDECPVGFTHVGDLESLLHRTDAPAAMGTLHNIAARIGWGAHELGQEERAFEIDRPFVFRDRMIEVLPWLELLDRGAR